jgi:DNA topoisomerase I
MQGIYITRTVFKKTTFKNRKGNIQIKYDFKYFQNRKEIDDKKNLERIKKLCIPPNWVDVKISISETSRLQAVGKDSKKIQYIYHPMWVELAMYDKYKRMGKFCILIPQFEKQLNKDINSKDLKTQTISSMFRILRLTHMRIGNENYATINNTYGICTLEKKHVTLKNKMVIFRFIGKKGVKHKIICKDSICIKFIKDLLKIDGKRLFQYQLRNNVYQLVSALDLNNYLQKNIGKEFTCKDFRTYASNILFLEIICKLPVPTTEGEKKTNLIETYDKVAEKMGHTRAISKKSYIMPLINDKYMKSPRVFYNQPPRKLLLKFLK